MPLIHIQDLETMAEHLRVNIITYMLSQRESLHIEALNDDAERDMYNFIFLTIQNYVLNPPESIHAKKDLCLFTKGLCFYTAFALTVFTYYCLRAATTAV
jgi:hypothetical protein